jgi:hypothetical protein
LLQAAFWLLSENLLFLLTNPFVPITLLGIKIRKKTAILAVAILSASCGLAEDNAARWLIGQWKSNRELTIPTIHLEHPLPPEKQSRFNSLFGLMVVTYDKAEMRLYMPEFEKYPSWSATEPYRIVAALADRVVIRSKNPRTKQDESTTIMFEGPNRYWVDVSGTPGVTGREYFDRIRDGQAEVPNKAAEPTRATVTPPADAGDRASGARGSP